MRYRTVVLGTPHEWKRKVVFSFSVILFHLYVPQLDEAGPSSRGNGTAVRGHLSLSRVVVVVGGDVFGGRENELAADVIDRLS